MKRGGRHPVWSWIIHTPWVLAAIALIAVAIFFLSGAGNPIISRAIVRRAQRVTGGKVELRSLSIQWFSLRASLKGLVIHGKEPAGTGPFFAADEIDASLRIDSFWGRKVSLDELVVERPEIHIRAEKNGSTNVPTPQRSAPNKPLPETLFALRARKVRVDDGWVLYNDVGVPLALEGDDLKISLDATG
ncbi:MAG: hypothetical protein C5B58_08855, partial [Acidobacteria bacterium]